MLTNLTVGRDDNQIAEITLIVAQVQELMDAFDFLSSVMSRNEIQSAETIEKFRFVAEYFGQIHRSYLNKNATPKVHLLEAHVPKELARHKRLGLFAEDPIEREHHSNKVYNQLFTNIKQWSKKQELILKRRSQGNVPEVISAKEEALEATNRKFSQSTDDKIKFKETEVKRIKTEKHDETAKNAGYK